MTSRLDRLLLLLDTGSSTSVRNTAAKQLAQLAAKSVISDVALEEDIKNSRQHVSQGDPQAWAELMAVVARIIPYLHSKSFDTRTAASVALSQIFSLVPLWQPESKPSADDEAEQSFPAPEFPVFSVQELISQGKLLLASSGKEFVKPAGILASPAEVKKARKAAMSRLGLDFLDEDDLEIEKELADEMDVDIEADPEVPVKSEDDNNDPDFAPSPMDVEPKQTLPKRESPSAPTTRSVTPADPSPTTTNPSDATATDLGALSARERNRLKRKRKPGNTAFVAAPPPQSAGAKYTPAPAAANSAKARLVASDDSSAPGSSRLGTPGAGIGAEKVVIDPSKGGAVSPKAAAQSRALDVRPGTWIWDGVVRVLEVDLFSAAWEVRHGAAMALRELLKLQGANGGMRDGVRPAENAMLHEKWCNDLSAKCLCVFVLDRFGDFVSDQVVAPVRETVSQTLAALLLHMPRRSVGHVHAILLQMIQQDVPAPLANGNSKARGGKGKQKGKAGASVEPDKTHVWEVRHAGLLGIKYEVAVRNDLFASKAQVKAEEGWDTAGMAVDGEVKREQEGNVKEEENVKQEESVKQEGGVKQEESVKQEKSVKQEENDDEFDEKGREVLRGVVEAAILGLGDRDDDVRSVAASCLLPVAEHLVRQLPEALDRVLVVLWHCLSDMKDDLSSSVGAVMDLLGRLVSYDQVIALLGDESDVLPLTALAPTLFPFFRHTIPNVRLAVVKTLASFMAVPTLPRDWIAAPFLRLLFQNLIAEERADIRDASLAAWRAALTVLAGTPGWLDTVVTQQLVLEWYAIVMTPLGVAIDPATFYRPSVETVGSGGAAPERHNVDKNMLAQDPSLITNEVTLKARVAAATALAQLIVFWPANAQSIEDLFQPILMHYVDSSSMLQKFLTAVVSEEWAHEHDAQPDAPPLIEKSVLAQTLSSKTLAWLQGAPPAAYHEMTLTLVRIHQDCIALLSAFASDCKLPMSSIPFLGTEIDVTGTKPGCFTIEVAQNAVGLLYTRLKDSLGRTKKRELGVIAEKRTKIVASIERYVDVKAQHDIRVSAAFAAAFVAFRSTPDKVSPVVKGIMNGIKNEENVDLQTRSAVAVASFIEFCTRNSISQPPDKIVKNLCTFLCQDVEQTPAFALTRKLTDGILSFQNANKAATNGKEGKEKDKVAEIPKPDDGSKTRLSRRGAGLAFNQLSSKFGARLLDVIPNMWQFMAGGLISAFQPDSPGDSDDRIQKQFGQDVIDSLSVLDAVAPTFHPDLWPKLAETFPMMHIALTSRFAIIRQCAARCFATLCDVMTSEAMRYVIENIVPLLGDPLVLANRQGATELMYHVVQRLDIKALPYVIFMVVPVLGRMSDLDDDIRSTATNTFASLVKMVPLEAGLPDPPGFPEELLKRRQTERQFLTQLLDGSKVDEYKIPVTIKAELRKYQQDGVNWLAFLAKYQLHGILCDDMGLGKTLQSICILSSKHFERAERHKQTRSPDTVHLPSLIVCPPTLTGHWYYEVLKYAENLRPVLYTGNARERNRLLPKLTAYDVVITSYEVVRNDIAPLGELHWLYCILDEGHVIKNAKTKLTKAVKCIRAQHRLILSGTPIQNNVLELWSLFDFLMPGFLGTEASFNERFGKPILSNRDGKAKNGEAAALALEALHKQVLPFLLRRLKEDVLHDLPPKIIQDYYCELSEVQKYLYDNFGKSQALASAEEAVQSGGDDKKQQHIFQSLQYLRKLCNHPAFVLKDADAIKAALAKSANSGDGLHDIHHAPKLLALKQILTDCGIGGLASPSVDSGKSELIDTEPEPSGAFSQHRVLIFCQMKQMLDIIETDLFKKHMPAVTYMRLDGGTDSSKRHAVVQTFNSDPSIDCLLLTTHIGGLGLTLTGADTVIFVEHDWNPMKDLQAMDRAHRIGQKKVVNVYRLITKGTLEEKIMGLQRFKLNIANSVVTQQNSGLASMDTDLVLDLFRRTSEEEDAAAAAKKKAKEASGPVSQKNLLQGLEELPAEDEYQGLDLSSFMGSLGR
ncbi:SNF2 superfamily chromatin remodeling protein [Mycena albidolilacea]|uniref:TATA-binding protein-associated factor mot1 n=1 Tax=Mycena albidolilacea TaxID=1033008 RepID=A0AAD7A518_9AGAR|nr:SNF2 superfamily chromatin remodeling protein [Mycena albidolilacea]